MNLKKKILQLSVVSLIGINSTIAQVRVTKLGVSENYIPRSNYKAPSDSARLYSKTDQSTFNFNIDLLLNSKINTLTHDVNNWSAGLVAEYLHFSNAQYSRELLPTSLFAGNIYLQNYRSLKNQWGLLMLASAGINSDMKELNAQSIFYNVGGVFMKTYSPNFSIGLGLILNNGFGAPIPIPAIIVNYQAGEKYKFNINLPDQGQGLRYKIAFTYVFNKQTDLGVNFKPSFMSYNIKRLNDNKTLLGYWQFPLALENNWHIGRITYTLNGGYSAFRSYRYGERKISNFFKGDPFTNLENKFFIGAGLKWAL